MAITKIHGIKATVSGAVKYICDTEKTDSSLYISCFATSPETAADDFKFTLSHTDQSDPNKAFHLIQSFAPGEVGADEAHQIGQELADRLLQGRHSYIVSTHTDHGHIHNHIIFCAADHVDYRKYHDCKQTYRNIRRINDDLCKEHNLSIIQDKQSRAASYKEWQTGKNGMSWKAQLKNDINTAIKQAHTYEEFLSLMTAKGYEIKDSGLEDKTHKYIAFRAPGQERWIRGRAKSLGEEYTRERIRERIEEKVRIRTERMRKLTGQPSSLIDTSGERFAESPGLKRWADLQNLKTAAKLQSQLSEMGYHSLDDVDAGINALHLLAKTGKKTTVSLDKQRKSAAELLRYARQYAEKGRYARNHKKSKDPELYYQSHSYELHLAWSSAEILEQAGINPEKMNLHDLESKYETLCSDRQAASDAYKKAERECENLKNLRDQLLSFMGQEASPDIDREKTHVRR